MSHPITIVSKDGLRKQTIKSTPMRTLQSVLEEYLAIAEQSEGFLAEQLELRFVEQSSNSKIIKKCDMRCPIRLMNIPKDQKFRVHVKPGNETISTDASIAFAGPVVENDRAKLERRDLMKMDYDCEEAVSGAKDETKKRAKEGDRSALVLIKSSEEDEKEETHGIGEEDVVNSREREREDRRRRSMIGKRSARCVRQKTLDLEAEDRNARLAETLVQADEELPEEFFELSSVEAAQIVAANRKKLEGQNFLMTKKLREQEQKKRRDKVQHATIRILFQKPSDVCIEAVFNAHEETVADVYEFVKETLAAAVDDNSTTTTTTTTTTPVTPFELFVAPPKRVLKRNGSEGSQTLYDAGLAPAAKIFFSTAQENFTPETALSKQCLEMLALSDQNVSAFAEVRPTRTKTFAANGDNARSNAAFASKPLPPLERAKMPFSIPKWFKK